MKLELGLVYDGTVAWFIEESVGFAEIVSGALEM